LVAYLITSHTPGMWAAQFQPQLGLKRYETAFQILHKLRSGMVRPDARRIPGAECSHTEVDKTWMGSVSRGVGRGNHEQTLVIAAVEVHERKPKPESRAKQRRGPEDTRRIRPIVVALRSRRDDGSFLQKKNYFLNPLVPLTCLSD
jgi:hypothetical protein